MTAQVGSMAVFSRWYDDGTAFVASYALAVAVHYSLNRFWALRSSRQDYRRQTGEYCATVVGSFLVNFCLFQLAVRVFRVPTVWAALVTNPPTTVVVFLILNFRVFRA